MADPKEKVNNEEEKELTLEEKIVKLIENNNKSSLAEYADGIKHDKEKDVWFYEDKKEKKQLKLDFSKTELAGKNEEIQKRIDAAKEHEDITDYSDTFEKIGEVSVMRNVSKLVGKADKPEDLAKSINGANYDDIYDLAFEKDKKIKPGQFNGRTPYEVMEACARRQAVEELFKYQKIDSTKYDQLVKKNGDDKEYSKDIATDAATKNKYEAIKKKLEKKFREGVVAARKKLDAGENLEEPFTHKTLNLEDGEISKAIKGAAKNAAGKVGEILGISKNSPDIFSKLVFASLAGGNKLWKAFKQNQKTREFNGQGTVKSWAADKMHKLASFVKKGDSNAYTEMQKTNAELYKQLDDFIKKNPDYKERVEKAKAFIEQAKKQAIPSYWALAAATGQQDEIKRVFEALEKQEELLDLLTEANETDTQGNPTADASAEQPKEQPKEPATETDDASETKSQSETSDAPAEETSGEAKVKELCDKVSDLLKIEKANEFTSKYQEWANTVNELLDKAAENEKLKPMIEKIKSKSDPYERLCLLQKAVAQQKKEPEKPKEEPKKEDESLEDDLLIHSFFHRLDEKLK
jgi:hypothetical protein